MKRQTKKLLLNIAAGIAITLTAAVVFVPAANAAPATATTNANVRATPGGAIIGTLRRGETVDVLGCSGSWCELDEGGFVSASLLARPGSSPLGNGLGISIGPGGVSIGVNRPPVIDDREDFGEVCFYERSRYRGDSFCMDEGESMRRLNSWDDGIASIRNRDGLRVTVCMDANYRNCRTYTSSASSLGEFDSEISSIRIR